MKSFTHVVRFGFAYASGNLIRRKRKKQGKHRQLPIQTQVNERRNPLIDVRLGREVVWLASVVDIIRVLVYSDVIHRHDRRERQMFEIDGSEVGRHSQVKDEILEIRKTSQQREVREWVRDKGGRKPGHAP